MRPEMIARLVTMTRLCALALVWLWAGAAMAKDVVIQAGRLIDGTSAKVRERASIIIHDDVIVRVENGFQTIEGADLIDLREATVLPGLIDCHVHVTSGDSGNRIAALVTNSPIDVALRSTQIVRRLLERGFTSARDVGAAADVNIAVKKAIEGGYVTGPRLWASGAPISPTGGHFDLANGLIPGMETVLGTSAYTADSGEQGRKLVRLRHRAGADLIKIMISGGVTTIGDDPRRKLMADDEVQEIIATAHSLGMKVAAHAHGKAGIDAAIRAGVDSIEHGSMSDAESYKLFKEHGTYLVPTLMAAIGGVSYMDKYPGSWPASVEAKSREMAKIMQANLGAAYRAGVKIAMGSDMLDSPIGTNSHEFFLMVQAGMAPIDAILAATANAADLLGAADKVGTIQPGRYADIVAVAGDPLGDITELERVKFVMKGGKVVRN